MSAPAPLSHFVEDELLRAPLLAQQVIDDVLDGLRVGTGASPAERSLLNDLAQSLRSHRHPMASAYAESLDETARSAATGASPAAAAMPTSFGADDELSLVDEDAIASDVQVSHVTETIKSVAEYELRELSTFTSALAGDMDVTRDHNPLGAQAHAHAWWAAAQQLTPAGTLAVAFMRHAANPIAKALRKAFASACTRLEDAGVQPALHRTVILPSGTRTSRPEPTEGTRGDAALRMITETLTGPALTPPPDEASTVRGAALPPPAGTDGAPVEQLIHLFDEVLADQHLPRDVNLAIARLQASAIRLVMRDSALLSDTTHPVWRFVDALAWQAERLPAPPHEERARTMAHVESLIDHVSRESEPTAALYRWALDRLAAFDRHRIERRLQAHRDRDLDGLDLRLSHAGEPATTAMGALDVAQLDTVPAELMDLPSGTDPQRSEDASDTWLELLSPGTVARLVLRGSWAQAQLLWRGGCGELWLWADCRSDAEWLIRRGALRLLHRERLVQPLKPRSLLAEARGKASRAPKPGVAVA